MTASKNRLLVAETELELVRVATEALKLYQVARTGLDKMHALAVAMDAEDETVLGEAEEAEES